MIARAASVALAMLVGANCAAVAQGVSLLGTWEIVAAKPAPWVDESKQAALIATGERMLKQAITFGPRDVTSKYKPFACKRAQYEKTDYEADALFQGNLPEPNPVGHAVRLGFKRGTVIPGVDLRCSSGAYSYHFHDRNTALFAFGNVIYTLKRQ